MNTARCQSIWPRASPTWRLSRSANRLREGWETGPSGSVFFKCEMREIVIDTETTGLDPLNGDRVVEIGAVEQIDRS